MVGLHPNTFKPHTGTKTSVLFVQKYTQEQLNRIAQVHDPVAVACPDYEAEIASLLDAHPDAAEVPEDAIPEAVADLIAETFSEPEAEPEDTTNGNGEDNGDDEVAVGIDEDPVALAEERLNDLKATLLMAKQRLMDLESDRDALEQQKDQEIDALNASWSGEKAELRSRVKEVSEGYQVSLKALKQRHKAAQKPIKAEIKALETRIPQAERDLKQLTNRGRLELILTDDDLIGTLKER
ncbi:MAG TPA: hypothetical protein VES73_04520 [Lamprocystis sp. (in: g-proteobacteria)]|nr:hypothetical protein [Lamprocystis sp. (in: g-proteobacteria)]